MNPDILPIQNLNVPSFDIEIEKATDLASFCSNGFSNPFLKLYVNGKEKAKTPTINKTLNPIWHFK